MICHSWKNFPLLISLTRCACCLRKDFKYEQVESVVIQICNHCQRAVEESDFVNIQSLRIIYQEKSATMSAADSFR